MMERIARLVNASTALQRKIWASLPFSMRIAEVFSRLASMGTDAFGKVMYGEFAKHNVDGLPDIHGKPALEVLSGIKNPVSKMPSGYGREFGTECFKVLMGKTHSPQLTEDLMSEFLVGFLESGSKTLRDGVSLKEAENFVLRGLQNAHIDWLRKHENARRNRNTLTNNEGDEESIFDHMPSFDENSAEKLFDERLLPQVSQKLKAVHPSAEQYVKFLLDGLSDRKILGDPSDPKTSLLDHPYTSTGKPLTEKNWSVSYKPKIFEVLKKKFEETHAV